MLALNDARTCQCTIIPRATSPVCIQIWYFETIIRDVNFSCSFFSSTTTSSLRRLSSPPSTRYIATPHERPNRLRRVLCGLLWRVLYVLSQPSITHFGLLIPIQIQVPSAQNRSVPIASLVRLRCLMQPCAVHSPPSVV